jgi:bacterioferritin
MQAFGCEPIGQNAVQLAAPQSQRRILVMSKNKKPSRKEMVELLNGDLAREYQAIIAYTVYSATLKGAAYTDIAGELRKHAAEELEHALLIAKQIDYFHGEPTTLPFRVKTSDKATDMLRFDLDNETETIRNYRERILQAEAMGEFALSEVLRRIIAQEQEHLQDLADALGIETPKISN